MVVSGGWMVALICPSFSGELTNNADVSLEGMPALFMTGFPDPVPSACVPLDLPTKPSEVK